MAKRKRKHKWVEKNIWYDTRVGELEISQKLIEWLRNNEVRYVGQILNAFANDEIYTFTGVSTTKLLEIKNALARKGVKFTLTGMEALLADLEETAKRRVVRARIFFDEPFPVNHTEAAYKFLHSYIKEHWPIICDYYGFVTTDDYSEIVAPYYKERMSMKDIGEKYEMSKNRIDTRIYSAQLILRRAEVRNTVSILYDDDRVIEEDKIEAEVLLDRLEKLKRVTGYSLDKEKI